MSTHQETCEEIKGCNQFKEREDAKREIIAVRKDRGLQRDKGLDPGIGCNDLYWRCRGLGLYRRIVAGRVQRDGVGRGCAMGFGNSLPTHRWLKGQYVYPLGDILVCLPIRRYTFPLEPIAYQKKKMELRLKCMSFAKRKQDLSSSEQNRSTLYMLQSLVFFLYEILKCITLSIDTTQWVKHVQFNFLCHPTRWAGDQYIYPLGDIQVCLPIRRHIARRTELARAMKIAGERVLAKK